MKPIDPRMQKLIKYQMYATFVNSFICTAGCFAYGFVEYGATLEMCVLAGLATFLLTKILNTVTLTFFQLRFYAGRFDEMAADTDHAVELSKQQKAIEEGGPVALTITILDTPEKPVGTFMGVEFFEWLDVKGNHGQPVRCVYSGTIPMEDAHLVPAGAIMIPPGILYQVEPSNK